MCWRIKGVRVIGYRLLVIDFFWKIRITRIIRKDRKIRKIRMGRTKLKNTLIKKGLPFWGGPSYLLMISVICQLLNVVLVEGLAEEAGEGACAVELHAGVF